MPEMLHPRGRRRDLRSPRSDSLDLLIGLTLPFEVSMVLGIEVALSSRW